MHGQLATEAVAALYAAVDIFALPSFKEPYGTVYGEAMAFEGWALVAIYVILAALTLYE